MNPDWMTNAWSGRSRIQSAKGFDRMIRRRKFLKIIGIGGVALAAPILCAESQPDVRGWRFGVWELQYSYCGKRYWARCDCGAEQTVSLDELLGIDALSCAHMRSRGFFPINPEHVYCVCGEKRRFFFNGDGMRIWRCGNCEQADVRAYLRRKYD